MVIHEIDGEQPRRQPEPGDGILQVIIGEIDPGLSAIAITTAMQEPGTTRLRVSFRL